MSLILTPEHRKDLERSRLTESTMARLGYTAVTPDALHRQIKHAESAYAIPYFHLDGTRNSFARWRLIPPVIGHDGKEQRYWQAPGTSPHLYQPPLVDWQVIARNPKTMVIVTEGEKKAACGCQSGLLTLGIGGIWCWQSTLDTGDKLVLPELDDYHWTGRPVEICPDSDAWHDGEKAFSILRGFFALSKDLQQRGASVQFVVLPDLHGTKAGLDDWLLVPGNTAEHSWSKLERIALDDPRFHPLTAWWQKWKEKQAMQHAMKQRDADALEMTETAGLYTVRASTHAVTMMFDRLTDQRGGVSAEVTVTLGATELLSGVDLGLKSEAGQTKLAKNLSDTAPTIPWKVLLQKACHMVKTHHRRGEPSRRLNKDTVVPPLRYSVNPFVHQRKPTILFADGGTGKSTLGLLCGMLVSVGGSVAGLSALKGKVLYLDYEDDEDVHARRIHAIQAGHPELLAAEVDYLRCTESIPRMLYTLVRKIQEDAITFLIVDSIVAAAGGEASLEAVGKLFAALRVLNIDILCIGHIPKPQQGEGPEHPTVYGSVFNQNYARMLWEVRREQAAGEDTAILALINPKSNNSRKHPPIGLIVTQNEEGTSIHYAPCDLSQSAELAKVLPTWAQIRNFLESQNGALCTAQAIADGTGLPLKRIQPTLSKHKGHKWQMFGGQGQDTLWGVLGSK